MKSKAPLTLMELLIMVLIFAMTVGLCVQIFVASDLWSQDAERRDRAVFAVQSAAEVVKYHNGDLEKAGESLDAEISDKNLTLYYDKTWNQVSKSDAVYDVIVELTEAPEELMGTASVTSHVVNGEELFRITVGWQEVSGDE